MISFLKEKNIQTYLIQCELKSDLDALLQIQSHKKDSLAVIANA